MKLSLVQSGVRSDRGHGKLPSERCDCAAAQHKLTSLSETRSEDVQDSFTHLLKSICRGD